MKWLLTGLLFTSITCFAGDKGNGGGGFCINGQCQTLAEAGIRINSNNAIGSWSISKEVRNELSSIVGQLPWGSSTLFGKTVGTSMTFTEVQSVDKKLLKKVMSDYRSVLSRVGRSTEEDSLVIFAISDDTQTFLLPSFFKLNDRQKALILIHEGIVRSREDNLELALKFDGELLDFLKSKSLDDYSPVEFYRSLALVVGDSSTHFNLLIKMTEVNLGRRLGLADFWDGEVDRGHIGISTIVRETASIAFSRNQNSFPEFMKIFENIKFSGNAPSYQDFSPTEISAACSLGMDRLQTIRIGSYDRGLYFVSCDTKSIWGLGLTNWNKAN